MIKEFLLKYKNNYIKAKRVLAYYKTHISTEDEKIYLSYLKRNKLFLSNNKFRFLSPIVNKYSHLKVKVYSDKEVNMLYVIHKGKKLYWPRYFTSQNVINSYRTLLIEQDKDSPHLYWNSDTYYKDKILFDIGAAEGIIALEHIQELKKVVLFECEDVWIDALNETFKPYKEKTHIIKKYVSDKTDKNDNSISIDDFVKQECCVPDMIKMDIEGFEEKAILGGENTLANNKIQIAVCTYHKPDAAQNIEAIFKKINIKYEYSKGYIIHDNNPAYLRHGVIRCKI